MSSRPARCWRGSTHGRRSRTWPPATRRSIGARHARSGDQGIRPPEAAVREELHQPGRSRARRGAVQGDRGPGFGATGSSGRGARAIRLLRRQGAVWRRDRRSPDRRSATWRCRAARCSPFTIRPLRVTAAVPQTDIARIASGKPAKNPVPRAAGGTPVGRPDRTDAAAHGRSGHPHRPDPARPAGDGRQRDTRNVCARLAADAGRGHARASMCPPAPSSGAPR